jgi:MSHA biogenesis protein MshJ
MMQSLIDRFDRLSMRERVLAVAAVIAVLVAGLNALLLTRLDLRRKTLSAELSSLQGSMASTASAVEAMNRSDATSTALAQQKSLQHDLDFVNGQLATEAAGMIAPQRMAEVIHEMLSRQHGVVLISLRNMPAHSVVEVPGGTAADQGGPYVHPVELVLEGSYLDILSYLHSLENMPWRFYWRVLDLQAAKYPVNRVRVELGTVSMAREWIGL